MDELEIFFVPDAVHVKGAAGSAGREVYVEGGVGDLTGISDIEYFVGYFVVFEQFFEVSDSFVGYGVV